MPAKKACSSTMKDGPGLPEEGEGSGLEVSGTGSSAGPGARKAFLETPLASRSLANIVMFLANAFKPDLRVQREAESLVKAGHQVRVLAWDRECRFPARETLKGVEIKRIAVRAPYGTFLPLVSGFVRFYIKLLLHSLSMPADAIHCHDMDTILVGIIASRLKGAKLVYDMHESYPDFISTFAPGILVSLLRFLEPVFIRCADVVIVTSSMIGEMAGRAATRRVVTVLNCFDPFPAFKEEAFEIRSRLARNGEFLLVYIGGLFAGRGLEEVIKAVSRLDGVKLFLGGYGPLEAELKATAKKLGAEEKVIFGGEIDPSLVPRYDAAADLLFALYKATDPNNVLTIPNKLFESMAAGKPIIVSDIGEKGRLVKEEGNGVAVDPDDPEAIVDAIRRLKDDPQFYMALASAAKRSQRKYSWSRMAALLAEIYSDLLS